MVLYRSNGSTSTPRRRSRNGSQSLIPLIKAFPMPSTPRARPSAAPTSLRALSTPPMWRTTGKKKATNRLGELALVGMEYTYSGIILNLGGLFLMIQFLTHTSAHPMSRAAYESSIKVVNKDAQHIKERARIDEDFCLIIASLIFPRVAILRNDIVKFITPKTDDYFKLTGYSSTKKDNRERVEKALQDYHFIFPVVWKKAAAAADGAADDAANPKLEDYIRQYLLTVKSPDCVDLKFIPQITAAFRQFIGPTS
ncbi:hypothetical protein R3P38DRAFT_3373042 [Favolaschia claudopus]|uniref:DUF6532 domain-containing protein n=1 Tax=Favolaschia claudopus TaxID=2862362 RepID=A0AAV9ZUH3_9AGAR